MTEVSDVQDTQVPLFTLSDAAGCYLTPDGSHFQEWRLLGVSQERIGNDCELNCSKSRLTTVHSTDEKEREGKK